MKTSNVIIGLVCLCAVACGCQGQPTEPRSVAAEKKPAVASAAAASPTETPAAADADPQPTSAAALGIEAPVLRVSAGGYMLDLRYRVADSAKAGPMMARQTKPYLRDRRSGAVLAVPQAAYVGNLRQTGAPVEGDTYFMLFANPGKYLKRGASVDLVLGPKKLENLTLQ